MEQNRVGVVTSAYSLTNYSGMLQGYVLAKACQKLGYGAISIDKTKATTREYRSMSVPNGNKMNIS